MKLKVFLRLFKCQIFNTDKASFLNFFETEIYRNILTCDALNELENHKSDDELLHLFLILTQVTSIALYFSPSFLKIREIYQKK